MCGRYTLAEIMGISQRFDLDEGFEFDFSPSYNVAPTQTMPIITPIRPAEPEAKAGRHVELMRWGLIPFWAKEASIGQKMFNARAETLAEKPSFRRPLTSRRCLVPTNGFYEWQKVGATKQPMYIRLRDEELFAFAGLYDVWKDPAGKIVKSYTVITTEPNELMAPIHNRMPVILDREAERFWLDPTVDDPVFLSGLLTAFPAEKMMAYPVASPRAELRPEPIA